MSFKVYLAGPEVFLPNAAEVLAAKIEICKAHGWEGLSPVDNEVDVTGLSREEIAKAIYEGNLDMMRRADAVIANITPFRGPHMDPGTAFEVGFFAAADKPVMVYTQHPDELVERVVNWSDGQVHQSEHGLRDRNHHLIEDFGLRENLMIESAIDNQGVDANPVVSPVEFGQVFQCSKGFAAACRTLQSLLEVANAFGPAKSRRRKP